MYCLKQCFAINVCVNVSKFKKHKSDTDDNSHRQENHPLLQCTEDNNQMQTKHCLTW